jgi:hypothetical protein
MRKTLAARRFWKEVPIALGFCVAMASGVTLGEESSKGQGIYEARVKGLLAEKCIACHGPLKQESGLRLDAGRWFVEKPANGPIGGPSEGGAGANAAGVEADRKGPVRVVVPGSVQRSPLLARVSDPDPQTRMPPPGEGTPLTDEELELLRSWIEAGAEYPEDESYLAEPKEHWAFRPLVRPAVPMIDGADANADESESSKGLGANPIDAFLAAAQAEMGTIPLPRTDDETLLRRWALDLTGLPPSDAMREAYLSRQGGQGVAMTAQAVDAMLAGTEYPERWARHWMDVWRYSDWDGYKQELRGSQRHIWRWRDWIIESLAEDKPYDELIVEMLAADEAFPLDEGKLRATGFLARNFHRSNRNIWLDATVEHTAKAFLGLTIACAKCHDHKYDPISQEDYYRFRAIFEPHQTRTDMVEGEPDPDVDGVPRVYDANLEAKTQFLIGGDEKRPDEARSIEPGVPGVLGYGLKIEAVSLPREASRPYLRESVRKTLIAAADKKLATAEAGLAKATAKQAAAGDKQDADKRDAEAAVKLAGLRVAVAKAQRTSLLARFEAELAKQPAGPSEEATRLAAQAARRQREELLGQASLTLAEKRDALQKAEAALDALDAAQATTTEPAEGEKEKQEEGAKKAAEAKAAKKAAVETAAKGVIEAEAALQGATRAILDADDASPQYDPPAAAYPETSSGRRLALARWITDPRNPLTARVAVNQIWMRHFGKPLVENVFDFGLRSTRPGHAELLDWLASTLIDGGWRLKPIHRLIVTSQAYARASGSRLGASGAEANALAATEAENLKRDPDNLTYWRFDPKRLEAEAIRDSLLAVAGSLDGSIGGPDIDHALGEKSHRRSLYFRHAYEKQMTMLTTFDAASPIECYRRDASIIPQQALVLSNSKLAREMSQALAERLWAKIASETDPAVSGGSAAEPVQGRFIKAAFQKVLGRGPTVDEVVACEGFLAQQDPFQEGNGAADGNGTDALAKGSEAAARASLVQVLINHNDFVTVR